MQFAPVNGSFKIGELAGFDSSSYLAQEKLDGQRAMLLPNGELVGRNSRIGFYRHAPGVRLDGELMPSGEFIAFDMPDCDAPIEDRLARLDDLPVKSAFRVASKIADFGNGIVASGGEGVVLKLKGSSYLRGGWIRFKRTLTLDATVAAVHPQAVELIYGGTNIGRAQCFIDVEPGAVVEIQAMQWTRAGKLRHAHVVRARGDKSPHDCARLP